MTPPFADAAARITPYPFVVHQVPSSPDNADASRTTSKKKRQRSRAERNPHQEEEVRFNTGPVRYGAPGSRRGSRPAGRSFVDDRNGIPDYPPPSFQEAINTGLLSQSSLSLTAALMSSIPEDNQSESSSEPIPTSITQRMEIDPPDEASSVPDPSESDDSVLVIINKNEIPVCSTDFPPAKHENKKDWFKRRKQDPVPVASPLVVEKFEDVSKGKRPPKLTITINPNPGEGREEEPLSSPRRRFLSLSPMKTIFPPKAAARQDGPLSATASPSSPKFPLGNKNFFRSTISLTTSSLLRLPSQKKESISRRVFSHKGKGRIREPIVPENLQDNWEVVEQSEDEGGEVTRPETEEHPQSLMTVVIHSFSASDSTTTFPKNNPSPNSRSVTPSDDSESHSADGDLEHITSQTSSTQIKLPESQISSSNQPDPTPGSSVSSTPLARTPTFSPPQPFPADRLQHRTSLSALQPVPALSGYASPSPNVIIDPREAEVHKEAPFPTSYESSIPSTVGKFEEKLPPPLVPVAVWSSPAASHSIPDLLTNSDHTTTTTPCGCGTRPNLSTSFNAVPSPLGVHVHPTYRTPTPPQFTFHPKPSAVEEVHRLRYAGRPLPRPPPVDFQGSASNPVLSLNTAGKSNDLSDDVQKGKGREREGLLIDLEDTSLDSVLSPTTTIRSDESRYHSQVYLPLLSTPSSSTIFAREPLPMDYSFSPSSIPGPNQLMSYPQHRDHYPHSHRFPHPLSQYQQPTGFSKSSLDLPSRFHDGRIHESLQTDPLPHRHHGYRLGDHCCTCEHSVVSWSTHPPPPLSMSVTHGAYQPHYPPHLTVDNAQRQRHHLAHMSY